MDKFGALWEFQQADMELAKFESQLKNTKTRSQLLALQKYMQEHKQILSNLENETLILQNEISDISAKYEAMSSQMEDYRREIERIQSENSLDLSRVRDLIHKYELNFDKSNKHKRHLKTIKANVDKSNEEIVKIVKNMQKAKKQFDTLKNNYDEEIAKSANDLENRKKAVEEISKTVDKELLSLYKKVHKNYRDPVARIVDKKCTGCNMELPSGDLLAFGKSNKVLLCENCGRILIFLES